MPEPTITILMTDEAAARLAVRVAVPAVLFVAALVTGSRTISSFPRHHEVACALGAVAALLTVPLLSYVVRVLRWAYAPDLSAPDGRLTVRRGRVGR